MRIVIGGLLGAVLLLTGMVSAAPAERLAQREDARPPRLKLTSTAFRDAGPLPLAYTCYAEGGNAVSPSLQWSFAPEDTASFTLMVVAPDNHQGGSLTQAFFWVRWNIPASTRELPQNVPLGAERPDGSRQVEGRGNRGIPGAVRAAGRGRPPLSIQAIRARPDAKAPSECDPGGRAERDRWPQRGCQQLLRHDRALRGRTVSLIRAD